MEIEIENKKYPLFFNMTALENVMVDSGMQDFSQLGSNKDIFQTLKFARDCAFYGIKSGCKRDKIEMPFESSEDLGDHIESFADLEPAIEAYNKAVGSFFQKKEPQKSVPK